MLRKIFFCFFVLSPLIIFCVNSMYVDDVSVIQGDSLQIQVGVSNTEEFSAGVVLLSGLPKIILITPIISSMFI